MVTHSRVHQTVKRQILDQAETNDEAVVTQVSDQMQVTRCSDQRQRQNSTKRGTKPFIRKGDIDSLSQEVARYFRAVSSTVGTQCQKLLDLTKRPTYHHRATK